METVAQSLGDSLLLLKAFGEVQEPFLGLKAEADRCVIVAWFEWREECNVVISSFNDLHDLGLLHGAIPLVKAHGARGVIHPSCIAKNKKGKGGGGFLFV
jgi:hypothetical protein